MSLVRVLPVSIANRGSWSHINILNEQVRKTYIAAGLNAVSIKEIGRNPDLSYRYSAYVVMDNLTATTVFDVFYSTGASRLISCSFHSF